MSRVILGITISLDGFVADRSGSVERLYPDLASLRDTDYMKSSIEETGASSGEERGAERTAHPASLS